MQERDDMRNGMTNKRFVQDPHATHDENHGETLAFIPSHAPFAADVFPADASANRSCEKLLVESSGLDIASSSDVTKDEMRTQDKMQDNMKKKERFVQDAHARQDDNHGVMKRNFSLRLGTGSLGSDMQLKKAKTTVSDQVHPHLLCFAPFPTHLICAFLFPIYTQATQRCTPIQGKAPPGIQPSFLRRALPAAVLAITLLSTTPVAAAPATAADNFGAITANMNKESVSQGPQVMDEIGKGISKITELLTSSPSPSKVSKGGTFSDYFSDDAVLSASATFVSASVTFFVGVSGFIIMSQSRSEDMKIMTEQRREDMKMMMEQREREMEQRREDMKIMMEQRKEDMEQRKQEQLVNLIFGGGLGGGALYAFYNLLNAKL